MRDLRYSTKRQRHNYVGERKNFERKPEKNIQGDSGNDYINCLNLDKNNQVQYYQYFCLQSYPNPILFLRYT